jgi:hypothetical protein
MSDMPVSADGVAAEAERQPQPEPEQEPQSQQAALPRFRAVELFGGAMGSQICSRFADVATFRQVPDSQEVFVDTASQGSLTLELLERQGAPCDSTGCCSHAHVRSADKITCCPRRHGCRGDAPTLA